MPRFKKLEKKNPFANGKYRQNELVTMLNNRFSKKKTGKPFTYQDVNQYAERGRLPDFYGGNEISVKYIRGVKWICLASPNAEAVEQVKQKRVRARLKKREEQVK